MSLIEILKYPEPKLRKPSVEIKDITDEVLKLLDDMAETMYDAPGIGLAAPQIGKNIRVAVIDIGKRDEEEGELIKLINPSNKMIDGEEVIEEGCLSVPGITEAVKRPDRILVTATSPEGKKIEFETSGLLSRVIQHEFDHLEGILFIDRVSKIKKELIKMKLRKGLQDK